MRVLLILSHVFIVLSSLFSRHGSQIQSTIHQRETTQDKHTRLLLNPVKKPLCLVTLRGSQHPEQLTCTSKDQERGSMEYLQAQEWVFLGSQQLPPRHVDVVERFFLASRKWSAAELHAPLTWWPHRKSMH